MKISHNEIASVELLGMLDGNEVKLIKTKGGLNLAIGVDQKGNETVMGAASHPAILCYNIERSHPSFHPSMMKSEGFVKESADKHSHFLSNELRKSGHDIYSVQSGPSIDFYVTKHDLKLAKITGAILGDTLVIQNLDNKASSFYKEFASAVSEKSLSIGIKKVKMDK